MNDTRLPWVDQALQREFSDALLDTVGALVCVIDQEGRIVRFNRASERLSGYTIEEVRDRPFWEILIPPDEVEGVKGVIRYLVEQKLPNGWDNHWITKRGERRLIRWTNTVLRDGDRFAWIIGTGIDITDRMRAEEERDRLLGQEQAARAAAERAERRAAFLAEAGTLLAASVVDASSLPDALVRHVVPFLADWCAVRLLSASGVVRTAAFAHVDPEVVTRLAPLDTLPAPSVDGGLPVIPEGRSVVVNGRAACLAALDDAMLPPSQRDRVLAQIDVAGLTSYMAVPLSARGRLLGAVVFGSSREDRTFRPDDLVLAEAIGTRAALALDNAQLYRDAQRALAAREEFLLVASHELRTPLTSLQTAVQALLAHARDAGDPPWGAPLLAIVLRSTARLTGLADDILDISRLTSGSAVPVLEDLDLAEVVGEAIEAAGRDLRRAGCVVSVSVRGPSAGRWDRRWILRIVHHLLANAVKYGPDRPIEVAILGSRESVRVAVRDHGIGIPAEEQARIFERFERAVPVLHYGGLGLGLWIVRRMAEELGGRVFVESRPGDGATFTVELPVRAARGRTG